MNAAIFFASFVAELRWSAFGWTDGIGGTAPDSGLAAVRTLDGGLETSQLKFAEQCSVLRSIIRKHPCWVRGHLLFAENSLELDDVASAYASLQGVQALQLSQAQRRKARHLLARCFLKRGQNDRALEVLVGLWSDSQIPVSIGEDLAAAYMALTREQDALKVLEGIDRATLSNAALAALAYLQRKNNGTLYGSQDS